MAEPIGDWLTTCPLCLGVQKLVEMLTVKIAYKIPPGKQLVALCRTCCSAVADALYNEKGAGVDDGRINTRAGAENLSNSGGNSTAPTPSDPLVPEDQPSNQRVGVDSGESGAAPSGEGVSKPDESESEAGRVEQSTGVTNRRDALQKVTSHKI